MALIKQIWSENPGVWIDEFGDEVVDVLTEGVELEKIYAYEACPDEILDMSAEQFSEYVEHIAGRRLGQLDLPEQHRTDDPSPWMSKQINLNKGENLFETQMTEHQSGGSLDW